MSNMYYLKAILRQHYFYSKSIKLDFITRVIKAFRCSLFIVSCQHVVARTDLPSLLGVGFLSTMTDQAYDKSIKILETFFIKVAA